MSASGECCTASSHDCIDRSQLLVLQVAELQQGSVGQLQAELRQCQAAATDLAQRMANLQNQILTEAGGLIRAATDCPAVGCPEHAVLVFDTGPDVMAAL